MPNVNCTTRAIQSASDSLGCRCTTVWKEDDAPDGRELHRLAALVQSMNSGGGQSFRWHGRDFVAGQSAVFGPLTRDAVSTPSPHATEHGPYVPYWHGAAVVVVGAVGLEVVVADEGLRVAVVVAATDAGAVLNALLPVGLVVLVWDDDTIRPVPVDVTVTGAPVHNHAGSSVHRFLPVTRWYVTPARTRINTSVTTKNTMRPRMEGLFCAGALRGTPNEVDGDAGSAPRGAGVGVDMR